VDADRDVVPARELEDPRAAAEADALARERHPDRLRLRVRDAAEHGVRRLRAELARGLAAHPEREVRRRRRIPGRDDARVVDAGQRLIGDEAAHGVGGQAAAGGEVGHAEARGPDRHGARQRAPAAELDGVARHGRHRRADALQHGDPERGQPPGHRASAARMQVRAEHVTAHQRDGAARLRQLGGRLDAGRARSDDRHGRRQRGGSQHRPQPLRLLEGGDRVGVLGRTGRRRVGAVAAHGVDQVVVVHGGARRQRHPPLGHVDPDRGVDHQPDAVGQYLPVVDDRVVGPGDQLVQADPLDEGRSRVDQGHGHVGALGEAVGRHDTGVPAADDDHIEVLVHAPWTTCGRPL